ncbi:MAG: zf-HC2 domain-containing protein [Chloroflexi bacterium]|jgi:hypothetical protein|nr:zf-HC2 domain-containing protein [Chloroflexota bacterium]
MSGLQRIVRHPDRTNDPHARAHGLTSDSLLGTLDEADAAWLDEHLAGCDACLAAADGFAADAALLRGLREDLPPAPRDLGARVSLALDDEVRRATRRRVGGRARGSRAGGSGRPRVARIPSLAFAGLAAAAVVALVVGPLSVPPATPAGTGTPPAGSLAPAATPITVDAQTVAWVSRAADGTYVISSADVDRVCPGVAATACGTLDGSARTVASLNVKPSSVLLSPGGNPAVVVGEGSVYVVAVDLVGPVTSPAPSPSSVPSSEPAQSPAATGEPASPPADSPAPSDVPASPEPASPSPGEPSATPEPTPEPATPTPEPATPTPGPADPSATPAPATPLPTMPPPTPAPTAAASFTIAEQVVLVGSSPAYSPDGLWVAFSARPADGAHGPDIFAWRVGEPRAIALTYDHGSVFSGWVDGQIVASSARLAATPEGELSAIVPPPDTDPTSVVARSYLLDPAVGTVTQIPRHGVWRPVVDATNRVVVYWTGSLAWSDEQLAWIPADGSLVAADWRTLLDPARDPAYEMLPSRVAGESVADWEVRFDPAGRRLGVWVADPAEEGTGRLALVNVEDNGKLGEVVLPDVAALRGFSLDSDRLAWSTPPGQNGEGSLITVYAWRGDDAGQLQSLPTVGDEPVVVAR